MRNEDGAMFEEENKGREAKLSVKKRKERQEKKEKEREGKPKKMKRGFWECVGQGNGWGMVGLGLKKCLK